MKATIATSRDLTWLRAEENGITVLDLEAVLPILADKRLDHIISSEQPGGCRGCYWCKGLPPEWRELVEREIS